jgi:hypothetical protein|tara:strand:- start:637 stop:906 length:270 start_codon:yes stop_codon:yes gene_type:complete
MKIGGINEKVRINPGSASLQSVIGMMEYWSSEILSSEERNNDLLSEFYNGGINGIIQNSLKEFNICCVIKDPKNINRISKLTLILSFNN